MKYTKNYNFWIGFGAVGRNAYKVSKVWKLGCHLFKSGGYLTFRICFLRTKEATYYWEVSAQIKKQLDCCCG